jgi:hypothetical protein
MEETSMNETRYRWLLGAAAVVLAVTLSAIAYDVGLSQGAARVAAAAGANATATAPPADAYRPYRHWGAGPLFPLLFIFFWIFLFRGFWWGGPPRPWWRHYYGGPSDRETFDEWHRRAHDQMKS